MVQGLYFLKNKGVIHCDMKPENIIFTDETLNDIKIIDFGASCMSCDKGFFYVQSRYYRAPEIVLGNRYDHAVDMWSLGCIVFELITGKPLFPAKDENELIEFFFITLGPIPDEFIATGKNQSKFYKKRTTLFGSTYYEMIRSKITRQTSKLKERSEDIKFLLQNFQVSPDLINFIERCLVFDPALRLTSHEAIQHPWFNSLKSK